MGGASAPPKNHKMKNKFYISKTVIYLVGLVLAVAAGFYLVNYVNTQKLSKTSEAAALPPTNCSTYNLFDLAPTSPKVMKSYCSNLYKDKYQYGGGWGNNATCYSRTKICATSPTCKAEDCLRCLNERVYVSYCVVAKVAPANVLTRQIKCPPDGKIKYGWGEGNKCYSLNGGVKTRTSGEPYCANVVVDDSYCSAVPTTNAVNYSYCLTQKSSCGALKYGEELPNSSLKCGCDVAGKYRYSTFIPK